MEDPADGSTLALMIFFAVAIVLGLVVCFGVTGTLTDDQSERQPAPPTGVTRTVCDSGECVTGAR